MHWGGWAGTNCSPRTGRPRLPFTVSCSAGRRRTPNLVRRTPISFSRPAKRPSVGYSPNVQPSRSPTGSTISMLKTSMRPQRASKAVAARYSRVRLKCLKGAGSSGASTRRARSLHCRESGASMLSRATQPQKSAGRLRGAEFHPEAGWSTSVAADIGFAMSRDLAGGWLWSGFGEWFILSFRPGDVVGDHRHDCYASDAHKELREQRTRTHHQFEMSHEREEDADAEHRKRLLTTDNQRIEHLPLQARPVLGHEPDHQNHDHHEMDKAIGRKIGLVVGVER